MAGKSRTRQRNAKGQGDQLRSELIEAAIRLLERLGPEDPFSLRAVAAEAKVSAPSVYLHFTDRDALFLAVLEKMFSEQIEDRHKAEERAALQGGGAWERLMARSFATVDFAMGHSGHYKVLYEGRVVARMADPMSMAFGRPLLIRSTELVREIIAENPVDRITQDPERLSLLLWSGIHGVVSLQINKRTLKWPDAKELVEQMAIALIRPASNRLQ